MTDHDMIPYDEFAEMVWIVCKTLLDTGFTKRGARRVLMYMIVHTTGYDEVGRGDPMSRVEDELENMPRYKGMVDHNPAMEREAVSISMQKIGKLMSERAYTPARRKRAHHIFRDMLKVIGGDIEHLNNARWHLLREESDD